MKRREFIKPQYKKLLNSDYKKNQYWHTWNYAYSLQLVKLCFPNKKICICLLLNMSEQNSVTQKSEQSKQQGLPGLSALKNHNFLGLKNEVQLSQHPLMSFEAEIHHWGFCAKEVSGILTCWSIIVEVFKVSHTSHFHLLGTIKIAWSQQVLQAINFWVVEV